MNAALCDIGCDEYGYPVRLSAHDADMQNANEPEAPNSSEYFDAICIEYAERIAAIVAAACKPIQRQPLSASWHHLACITAPLPRTMPARALFCKQQAIGLRAGL